MPQDPYGLQPYQSDDPYGLQPYSPITIGDSFQLKPSQYSNFMPPTPPEPSVWDDIGNMNIPLGMFGGVTPNQVTGVAKGFGNELYNVGKGMIDYAGSDVKNSQNAMNMLEQDPNKFQQTQNQIMQQAGSAWKSPFQVGNAMATAADPTGIYMGASSNLEGMYGAAKRNDPGAFAAQLGMLGLLGHGLTSELGPPEGYVPENRRVAPGDTYKLPGMAKTDFSVGAEPPAYQRPFQFFEPAQQGSLNFGDMPDTQYNLPIDQYRNNGQKVKLSDMQNLGPDAFSGAPRQGGWEFANVLPDPRVAENIARNAPTPDELASAGVSEPSQFEQQARASLEQPTTPTATPQIEGVRFDGPDRAIVSRHSKEVEAQLKGLGFSSAKEMVPNTPDAPGGFLFTRDPVLAETPFSQARSGKGRGITTNKNGEVVVPSEKVTAKFSAGMAKDGLTIDRVEGMNTIYKKSTEGGAVDISPLAPVARGLRKMFGADPALLGETPSTGNPPSLFKRFLQDESGTFDPAAMRAELERLHQSSQITGDEYLARSRDLRYAVNRHEIQSATDPAELRSHAAIWQGVMDLRDRSTADPYFMAHAQEMADFARERERGLRQTTPPNTRIPSSDYFTGNREGDIRMIRNSRNSSELDVMADHYGDTYEHAARNGDQARMEASYEMTRAIDDARDALHNPIQTNQPQMSVNDVFMHGNRDADLSHIRTMTDPRELHDAIDHYSERRDAARASGSPDAAHEALRLGNEVQFRINDLHSGVQTMNPIQGTTAGTIPREPPPTAAPDVPNKPIIPGQYPTPKARIKFDEATRGEVRKTNEGVLTGRNRNRDRAVDPKDRPQYKADGTPDRTGWDGYAWDVLQGTPAGPPGLSVEKYWDQYRVVYRDPEGNPVTVAKITEDLNGRRHVETLGSDRFRKTLHARGVYAVGSKLVEYNATRVDGAFSQHTARLLGKIVEMIKDQGGEFNLGAMTAKLQQIKQEMMSGKPWFKREIQSPEDLMGLIDEMNSTKANKSLIQRFLNSNDTGAVGPADSLLGKIDEMLQSPSKDFKDRSYVRKTFDLTRGAETTGDLSAALKQGAPLAFTKEWNRAFGKMVQSLGSERAAQASLAALKEHELFQKGRDEITGERTVPSYGDMVGMKLAELDEHLNKREEMMASPWVESGAFLGEDLPFVRRKTAAQAAYKATAGRFARASNRAYVTFLNDLRVHTLENLVENASKLYQENPGVEGTRDPMTDLAYGKEISDFVNTSTGRAPLKTHVYFPTERGQVFSRSGFKEVSGERFAKPFAEVMFAPRLIARTVRMMNPATYMMASPFVRRQYLKAALRTTIIWGTGMALGKMTTGTVEWDPRSADFGKVRYGNLRIDPGSGFLQYVVPLTQIATGHRISSASGQNFELGQGYKPDTRKDLIERAVTNKLHPAIKYAYDFLDASQHQPFHLGDRTVQLFVPMFAGDLLDIARTNPELAPTLVPTLLGMGSQMYDRGTTESKYIGKGGAFGPGGLFGQSGIPDYSFTGGGLYGNPIKRKGI